MHKSYRSLVIIASALLLVGFGCGKKAVPPTPPASNEPASTAPEGSSLDMRIAGNVVIASEQKPGPSVKIVLVDVDKPSFIVIREDHQTTGKVVGQSALLDVGESMEIIIGLSRPTRDGEKLYAALYADSGDGIYGPEDAPLLDFQGNPMYAIVDISASAEEGPAPVL